MRTPLAWMNLTHRFGKCALAATGVGFAVVLMFMQIGFRNALIDSNVQVFKLFNPQTAALAMVSRARYNLSTEQRFPLSLLEQAGTYPGILGTCAVNIDRGTAGVQVEGFGARPIRVIGIELCDPSFFSDERLFSQLQAADRQVAALVDRRSKSSYGFAASPDQLAQQKVELNQRDIPILGQFNLGTDFANDGTLLMSRRLHEQYFPWRSRGVQLGQSVDIGLLSVVQMSSSQLDDLARRIESLAPESIDVRRTQHFVDREKEFWARATPIGKIFFIGTIMGLVVGAIICYQIQFTDISEHMPEFATLKAMGYGTGYFWSVVLWQSVYLACLGFVPGLAISYVLYVLLAASSGLLMSMTWDRVLMVWCLTMLMCMLSGGLAIRKLFSTDPANLF